MTPAKSKRKNQTGLTAAEVKILAALGAKGGKARARKLTPERRSEIARLGAEKVNAMKAAKLKAKKRPARKKAAA